MKDFSLSIFSKIHFNLAHHPLWSIAKEFPNMKQQCHFLISTVTHWDGSDDDNPCSLCSQTIHDYFPHAVNIYPALAQSREEFWSDIATIDINACAELNEMSDNELHVILNFLQSR